MQWRKCMTFRPRKWIPWSGKDFILNLLSSSIDIIGFFFSVATIYMIIIFCWHILFTSSYIIWCILVDVLLTLNPNSSEEFFSSLFSFSLFDLMCLKYQIWIHLMSNCFRLSSYFVICGQYQNFHLRKISALLLFLKIIHTSCLGQVVSCTANDCIWRHCMKIVYHDLLFFCIHRGKGLYSKNTLCLQMICKRKWKGLILLKSIYIPGTESTQLLRS